MKKNSIEKFLFYLNFIRIIIFRKILFFFKKIKSKGYINIEVDETFNHSLIKIEYFFEDLLYVELPKVGKHFQNGTIYLQTQNIAFPYYFIIKTTSKKEKYKIEFSPENQLNMDSIKILNLKKIQIETKKPSIKLKEKSQLALTKISSVDLKKITIKEKSIKLNHSIFNKNDYYEK